MRRSGFDGCTILLFMVVSACSDSAPIRASVAVPSEWTFQNVDGNVCGDGTATGLGLSDGDPNKLFLVLDGGGACSSYNSCVTLPFAARGPFQAAELDDRIALLHQNAFTSRNNQDNPVSDWTFAFIPYCTGDLHAGDRVATYIDPERTQSAVFHHVGRTNLESDLAWLVARYPNVEELTIVGLSAGGFGALLNHVFIRGTWPSAKVHMVSDGGPPLDKTELSGGYPFDWLSQWNAAPLAQEVCGDTCDGNFAVLSEKAMRKNPNDRFAILSATQDAVDGFFFGLDGPSYERVLRNSLEPRFARLDNVRTFVVAGTTHVLLSEPSMVAENGVSLDDWLRAFVEDKPLESVAPW